MILIIGGMGFIGLNTALRFMEASSKRVVLSQQRAPHSRTCSERDRHPRHDRADGRDQPVQVFEVVRRHQVESIVNR